MITRAKQSVQGTTSRPPWGLVGRSVRHERTLSFVLSRGSFRKPTVTGKLPYLGAAFTRRIFAFPIAQELAAGFLLSEAVIRDRALIKNFTRPETARNRENIITVDLAGGTKVKLNSAQRLGTISSSCGLCGKKSIDAIRQNFAPITSTSLRISIETLLSLPDLLRQHQSDFARTGGIHAAGIFGSNGEPLIVREDIGRHNAVDKAIGRAFLDGNLPLGCHILLVSGRASLEIMQKALAAGIPIVASVSAPSSLAMEFARDSNQTLVGFLRPPSFNIYSHVERIVLD